MNKVFNSKVILFGEYAVLKGGKLLAMPFNKFGGSLQIASKLTINQKQSHSVLKKVYSYIVNYQFYNAPNLHLFKRDLDNGLYFDSNIPQAYGIGSSGALVAALYDKYFLTQELARAHSLNRFNIQDDLAKVESFFHGNSSGSDPLISYFNHPQLLNAQSQYDDSIVFPNNIVPFLIDTGIQAATGNFVKQFTANKNNERINQFIKINNDTIDAFLNHSPTVFDRIRELTKIETELLAKMLVIPMPIEKLSNEFGNKLAIKLCGSGGGGFLLAFAKTQNTKAILEHFKRMNIPTFPLYNMDKILTNG